jgi:hypothetical protein
VDEILNGQQSKFLNLEDGMDKLSLNVGKELPLYAAEHPRIKQHSEKIYIFMVVEDNGYDVSL